MKIITFSFDDGEIQDIRLAEMLRKYGLKATFGLTSGYFGKSGPLKKQKYRDAYHKVSFEDLKSTYEGFEVCSHGAMHRGFVGLSAEELRQEVADDNEYLEEIFGQECVGTIYPGGGCDRETADTLRNMGILYARTTAVTHGFDVPEDFLLWHPTCSFMDEKLFCIWEQFAALPDEGVHVCHIYGHSYELDFPVGPGWEGMERLCQMIASAGDVYSYTCQETVRYLCGERGVIYGN